MQYKGLLPLVISENQSVYLSNKLITDNVLVAFEIIHSIKNKKAGARGVTTLKFDMSRAFDRVEWSFL